MVATKKFNGKQYVATGGIRSKASMNLHIVTKRYHYRITKERGGYQLWVRGKALKRV